MGGAETQVCNLANAMADLNHEVTIISLANILEVLPSEKVKVFTLNMDKTIPGFIKAYLQCRKMIKSIKPDVIHSHMVHANIFARLLRLTMPIQRLICTAHSTNEGGKARMLAYRLTDRLADMSTNVSQKAAEIFIQSKAAKRERMIAVYNGIDTDRFTFSSDARNRLRNQLHIAEDIPLLITIGRLTPAKDYPNLLNAFARINPAHNAKLAIVGEGPLKSELQTLSQKLGIADRVYWLGMQKNVAEWLSAGDIFVLSSEWEGFGLVVAEAMACGRVVVATDAGGISEVMGSSDFLVPIKDPVHLQEKVNAVLSMTPEEKANIAISNRKQVMKLFSLPVITQRWLAIYKDIL